MQIRTFFRLSSEQSHLCFDGESRPKPAKSHGTRSLLLQVLFNQLSLPQQVRDVGLVGFHKATKRLHVAAEDPDALAAAVTHLSGDKALCQTFATAALAAAPGHSRETQAREMLDVLQMAAGGEAREAPL